MDGTPLFPVVLKDAAFVAPAADTWFVLAANGLFMERQTDLYTASVRADDGVPGLLPHEVRLVLRIPPLSRALVERAVGFFRAVHRRWEGEAILVLYYLPATPARPIRYALVAPPQTIRGRSVYGRFRADLHLEYAAATPPGPAWRKLGTFHSHGHLGPQHSAVDAHDEQSETGLHLTAGYVDAGRPEFAAAFVLNGNRFRVPPAMAVEAFESVRPWPNAWMKRIRVVEDQPSASLGYGPIGWEKATAAPRGGGWPCE